MPLEDLFLLYYIVVILSHPVVGETKLRLRHRSGSAQARPAGGLSFSALDALRSFPSLVLACVPSRPVSCPFVNYVEVGSGSCASPRRRPASPFDLRCCCFVALPGCALPRTVLAYGYPQCILVLFASYVVGVLSAGGQQVWIRTRACYWVGV